MNSKQWVILAAACAVLGDAHAYTVISTSYGLTVGDDWQVHDPVTFPIDDSRERTVQRLENSAVTEFGSRLSADMSETALTVSAYASLHETMAGVDCVGLLCVPPDGQTGAYLVQQFYLEESAFYRLSGTAFATPLGMSPVIGATALVVFSTEISGGYLHMFEHSGSLMGDAPTEFSEEGLLAPGMYFLTIAANASNSRNHDGVSPGSSLFGEVMADARLELTAVPLPGGLILLLSAMAGVPMLRRHKVDRPVANFPG